MKTLLAIVLGSLLFAGSAVTLQFDSSGTIEVLGSSNVRSWSCTSTQLAGTMEAELDGQRLTSVDGVRVSIPVQALNCGNGQLTSKVRELLANGNNNLIRFTLTNAELAQNQVRTTGTLNIAGVSRSTRINATAAAADNGRIRLTGEVALKMSDFGIDPPTAMLGTLRSDDDVTVRFNVTVHR